MTILTWPSTLRAPSAATLRLKGMTQSAQSPFDGSVQTLVQPGVRWMGSMQWGPMPPIDWRNLAQFLAQLQGRQGRFKLSHPMAGRLATATPGTPLVNGAGQTGASLVTDGWTAGALVLLRGDYFAWNNAASRPQLQIATADITANGSGQATITCAPPLRSSPADNAAIDVLTPSAVWMLSSDDDGELAVSGASAYRGSSSISFEEALA